MKARLRARLPLRFQNAVVLARRALQCERLESRCLMHALPLVSAYEADPVDSAQEEPARSVPAVVQQPSSPTPTNACDASEGTDAAAKLPTHKAAEPAEVDGNRDGTPSETPAASLIQTAAPVNAQAGATADKKPGEPDPMGGMTPEGEAAPTVESPASKGTGGSFNRGSTSNDPSDDTVPARASAPLGDLDNSVPVGRVTGTHDAKTDVGALTARPTHSTVSNHGITSPLGLAGDDAGSLGATAGKVTSSSSSVGLSLSPDVQTHKSLSLGNLSASLPLQSTPGRGLQSQGVSSSPWLFSSFQPSSAAASLHWSLASDGHVIDAMRSMTGDDDTDVRSAHFVDDSSDSDAIEGQAAENGGTAGALYALRAAIELSRGRQAKLAGAAADSRSDAARHARSYALQAYLRVREGSNGLIELAIEPPQPHTDNAYAYPLEPAPAIGQRNWNDASVSLYREFDLATTTDEEPTTGLANPNLDTTDWAGGDREMIDAIDAAHADGESTDSVAGSVREAALPIGLLTLSSLLAVSRHRFARKRREESDV